MNKQELINTLKKMRETATDEVALAAKELYPTWAVGITVFEGNRFNYGDKLYKVKQGHTTQAGWEPDIATSLFDVIDVEHAGTLDDPIPFSLGMEVFADKYYTYEGVTYLCTRDSGQALYNAPSELINNYFTVA